MMIKALKNIYDIKEGEIYNVVSLYRKEGKVVVIDDCGYVMVLLNDLEYGYEFEVIEE